MKPESPVGRLADFALLQAAVAQVLRRAELPAVAAQAAGEVDVVVERRRRDGRGHGAQAVQGLQQGDWFETWRHRVGALLGGSNISQKDTLEQKKKKKR